MKKNKQTPNLQLIYGRGRGKTFISANVVRIKKDVDEDGNKTIDVYYVEPTKLT